MRRILLVLSFVILIALAAPFAFAAPGAVRCGKLLDVRSGRVLTDQIIVFDANGMITAVGPAASTSPTGGVAVLDLSTATCLPGLIDVHTHLTGDPSASGYQGLGISVPREALTGAKNARLTVRAGFTTVRNIGVAGGADVAHGSETGAHGEARVLGARESLARNGNAESLIAAGARIASEVRVHID